ncbi:peptidoglycan hydrolase-like protein with peptidoglycan-binding domain [Leifsonia sp. EB41]|uniref:peptidoglycan-binding domain-containing protein n=1 Tax=Leifsonia sp. EB41 TaxID=3156260 RepID=UPI003516F48D
MREHFGRTLNAGGRIVIAAAAVAVLALAGCSGEVTDVDRAQAQVTAAEKAVTEAQSAMKAASDSFCTASRTYLQALDRYGDVFTQTTPTVGDVRKAGSDLAKPRDNALDGAEAAVAAQAELVAAQRELADARAALERAKAGPSGTPATSATPQPSATPLAPAATVDRVKTAESEFAAAQSAITDTTPLADASVQFNSAAVALEFSWLRLFVDAGCVPATQTEQAQAAVSAYVTTLQQDLAAAGYYTGAIDGVYGPQTAAAVEALQKESGLPVTGALDKATAAALQSKLLAVGGAAAQQDTATTAAVQQTLKLAGFWDGPVDGVWTPALTDALRSFQTKLGVEPTGAVDAATISALEKAIAQGKQATPTPTPSPSPTP